MIVLAIANLYFYPPDNYPPLAPASALNPVTRVLSLKDSSLSSISPSIVVNTPLASSYSAHVFKVSISSLYFSSPIAAII